MSRLASINLLTVLDVYLVLTFVLSLFMRYRQYRNLAALIVAVPGRWPKLFQLLREHRSVFFTWPTLLPVGLTFALMLAHSLVYNLVWPQARVTPPDLAAHWPGLVAVLGLAAPMLWLDYRAVFTVWEFDRRDVEKSLDQAEYWLRSWVAPALRVLTLGYVDPRQMVSEEVKKALTAGTMDLKRMMWSWSLQIAVRLCFGLSVWLTWLVCLNPIS
jgi:hypothetical protein